MTTIVKEWLDVYDKKEELETLGIKTLEWREIHLLNSEDKTFKISIVKKLEEVRKKFEETDKESPYACKYEVCLQGLGLRDTTKNIKDLFSHISEKYSEGKEVKKAQVVDRLVLGFNTLEECLEFVQISKDEIENYIEKSCF